MNPQVKQAWVKALRSGEYKQGRTRLRAGDKFCCLGVLCDLHAKQKGGEWGVDNYYYDGTGSAHDVVMPDGVTAWADIGWCCGPPLLMGGRTANIAKHNDDGATFADLAQAIEEQL